jgi:methylmalonyl-CoA mutase C-terminal domain/subunit
MTLFPKVKALLDEAGADDVLLTGGGIIPEDDARALEGQGIGRLFGPGTSTEDAIAYVRNWFAQHERV